MCIRDSSKSVGTAAGLRVWRSGSGSRCERAACVGSSGRGFSARLADLVDVAQVDDATLGDVRRLVLRLEVVQVVLHLELFALLLLARREDEEPLLPPLAHRHLLALLFEPALVQRRDERALVGPHGERRQLRLQHAEPRLHVAAVDRAHARCLLGADEVDAEVVEVHALGALDALDVLEVDERDELLLGRLGVRRKPVALPRALAVGVLVLEVGPALLEDRHALLHLLPLLALLDVAEHRPEEVGPRELLVLRVGREDPRAAGRGYLEAVALGGLHGVDSLGDGEVDGALALGACLGVEIEQPVRREEHAVALLEARGRRLAALEEPAALDLRRAQVGKQLVELAPPAVEDRLVVGAEHVRLARRLDLEEAAAVGRVDHAHLEREAHVDLARVGGRLRLLKRELAVGVEAEGELLPLAEGAHLHRHARREDQ
eukprot:7377939-Prymnesium_polylepis.1